MFTDLLYRLRALFRSRREDANLDEELQLHLDLETEKYVRSGFPEEEAKRRARIAIGGLQQATEGCRDARGISLFTETWQDVRYGVRVLRKSPALTAVAIVSLALGIGANTTSFSVVNTLILRPLPFPNADRLVAVQRVEGPTFSFPNYRDIRDRNEVFSGLVSYRITLMGLDAGGGSQRVWGYLATGIYFQILGAKPQLGRFFTPEDDRHRGGSPYAVLSHASWQNRFAGDPQIVDKTIQLNGLAYTILGVAEKGFQGTELFYWPEIWVPMSMQAQIESFSWLDDRATHNAMVLGRLKEGVGAPEAEARLAPIAAGLAKEYPNWNRNIRFKLARPGLVGDTLRGPVAAFTGGVLLLAALVLLAASANLASLLAARTADRHREIAVRMSLGAGPGRIARQLMTESLLLACAGGLAALGVASALLRLLSMWRAPLDVPIQFDPEPDWRVFVFTCAVSILSGIFFGFFPAHRAWRFDPNPALKGMPGKWTLRDILLPVQVALCCLLIMSCLVSVRGLQRAFQIPLGFHPGGVAVAGFDLSLSRVEKLKGRVFQRAILDDVARIPGVTAAAFSNTVPLSIDRSFTSVAPEEAFDFPPSARIEVSVFQVSPSYFRTMGTTLLNGREFEWRDDEKAPRVAIVNEFLARELFGGAEAVGRRFRRGAGNALVEVIGVVSNGKYTTLTEDPRPAVFWPATQIYNGETLLLARTSLPESQIAGEIRKVISAKDSTIAVHGVGTLGQLLGFAYFPSRAATIALGVFGALAVMLAATGIYGITAYTLSRRRRELGIRIAVGAQSPQILKVILGRTSAMLLAGSSAGFLLGLAAGPLLASVVYQATPYDSVVMICVPLAMASVGFIAVLGPARQAMKIDPIRALRQE